MRKPELPTELRILLATQRSDLAYAAHSEVSRLAPWRISGIVDPRSGSAFEAACLSADVVLIEAADLLWQRNNRPHPVSAATPDIMMVIILPDSQLLNIAFRVGRNCSFIIHETPGELPVHRLELAIRGYIVIGESLLRDLQGNRLRLRRVSTLSQEERGVLSLIGAALPNRRIAELCGIKESRAKTLVHVVTRKLRMRSRTGTAAFAVANGIAATSFEVGIPTNP